MAVAKETEGLTELEKQFNRIVVCNLCQRTVTNLKILPCFHSFCLNCLEENRPTTGNLQSGRPTTSNCPTCSIHVLIPIKGVVALPTNEFINSIIATADALNPILHISGFERTDGSASRPTAERSDPAYRRHNTGRGIGRTIKNIVRPSKVYHEDSRQSCASDKMQQMPFCKTHGQKFNSYCNNCTRVMCPLYNGKEHSKHLGQVISVDSAIKNLCQMISSYLIGVESCQAYYRTQNNICETAREGRIAAATLNRMNNTPVRPGGGGRNVRTPLPSSISSRTLSKHPETTAFLHAWKEWTRCFFKIITIRGLRGDILNIAKELQKLHQRWCNLHEQESPVQQSQNKNSPITRNHRPTSRRDIQNRYELEEKEQGIQKSLSEEREWMANGKRMEDIVKKQIEEKNCMEANLKERRDWFADESQKARAKSNPNIADNLHSKAIFQTPKVSQDKLKKKMLEAELRELREVNADLQGDLTQELHNEKRRRLELEKLISWIERIDTQSAAEFQMPTEGHSGNGIIDKLQVSIVKKITELSEENRLLLNRIEALKYQMEELKSRAASEHQSNMTTQGQLKVALRREGYLTTELADFKQRLVNGMFDNQQVNDTGLLRELKNLIKWIERGDTQPTEDQMTTEGESENSIIKKIKASIIKTTKELRDKEKQLLEIIEESGERNRRKFGKEFAREREQLNARIQELENQKQDLQDALTQQKEFNHTVQEKLKAALIKNRDETSLKQGLEQSVAYKKELSLIRRELDHLIQWVDTIDKQSTEQITLDEKSQSDAVQKLKTSVVKKTKELKATEKQLLNIIEESDRQITKLKQNLQQKHQELLNSEERHHKELMEKERMRKAQEKQINDMGNENFQLREMLKQRVEPKKSSREKLDQVSPTGANLISKNNFDASTAVQIVSNFRAPTGIRNMGNTCFFGATMQNLVQTVILTEELQLLSKQPSLDIELLLTNAYMKFLSSGYEVNYDQTFRKMFKEFCKKSSRFADRGQHDSHDLFVNFLNSLRDEERRSLGSVNSPGFRNVLTAVDKVFGGHTITVYVCSTCKTPYNVCEPFLDISVPILGPKDGGEDEEEDLFINHLRNPQSIGDHDPVRQAVETTMKPLGVRSGLNTPQRIFQKRSLMSESMGDISLKQCLVYYSRTERIHNEYLCNPCEAAGRPAMTSALKRTLIYNPPAVLVLHLKRFEQTTVGFKKCNQHVTYDEYLDIGPYCSSSCLRITDPDDANVWYSLYGVVVHKGSLTSGHYIAYIKGRYNCDTPQTKQFMQQTFLNRDQVLNGDEIRRINASRGMVRSRKEWKPREVEGQWYLADDEYVKAVEKTEALSQAAYLLFYERVAR